MYDNEVKILIEAKEVLKHTQSADQTLLEEFKNLTLAYERLLSDTQVMTKISDRLQNKLSSANERLNEQKNKLEMAKRLISKQNEELRQTKKELEQKVTKRTEELEQAYHDLLVANQELDNFVYRASHDLKGPIARLLGICMIALQEVEEEEAVEYFSVCKATSEFMDHILLRLLSINQLKSTRPGYVRFPLGDSVQRANEVANRLWGVHTLDIQVRFSENLLLTTDQKIFELIIENVLEYAIQNSVFPGEPNNGYIKLTFAESEQDMFVHMEYNGQRIVPTSNEKLFSFYRTSNHPGHTGMELYTARLAVEKLNGNIELVSSTQDKTVFKIMIPDILLG
ncbi:ATP-binding protein [Rapidithrix thailandica]|uniref:histidine kinase n=1 Tax=Rapidithrix thailandica TaxID=413964 RepID=A0AAW9RRD4_9BACT